jgi:hypothetical protein
MKFDHPRGGTMRLLSSLIALSFVGALSISCASKPKDEAPPFIAATPQTAAEIQTRYQAANPDVLVGVVTAVLPDKPWAAIGEIPTSEFEPGDRLTFIDSSEQFLTNGTVETITQQSVIVRFDEPTGGRRAPQKGDLAVSFQRNR